MTETALEPVPEDWSRGLAVVAHPDDMEYGAASAVARWTRQGKEIAYLLVTHGEAGIDSMSPEESVAARAGEQEASCRIVGVDRLEYLNYPDGLVVADLDLRRSLAGALRRHRPEVVIGINFRESWGGPSWNHADHRAVGVALLDAVRDAANRWIFPELGEPWSGVRFALFSHSLDTTHGVDVTDTLDAGIESLRCHKAYLDNLGADAPDPDEMLRSTAAAAGPRLGVGYAVPFELFAF
ncbi:MAG: PIG-L family deacetylase [Acidimicrobiia bacterium]|nr:PIG-L family deacetylase [Acidimicrobiia bacterium]